MGKNCRDCNKNDLGCVYTNATCTRYNTVLPQWSEIEGCSNIEETTSELYAEVTILREPLEMLCEGIEYVKEQNGTVKQHNAILGIEAAVCSLLEKENNESNDILNIDITTIGLDFNCLVTPCGDEIKTLKDLLQSLINKVCP